MINVFVDLDVLITTDQKWLSYYHQIWSFVPFFDPLGPKQDQVYIFWQTILLQSRYLNDWEVPKVLKNFSQPMEVSGQLISQKEFFQKNIFFQIQ